MELDGEAARALRASARRAWILAAVGALLVFGFVAAAVVDPNRFAPSVTAKQSTWWVASANIALTAGVVALLVAVMGLARVRRQRRTVVRSAFRRVTARWAPTVKRAQHVPGLALEQPDGSWLGLTLTATLRPRSFETRVRDTGAVDVAEVAGYAVVRAPGSTKLLSAKPKGIVKEPAPSGPSMPLITLRAGARVAMDDIDEGICFREATPLPTGTTIQWLLLFAFALATIVRSSINGDVESVGQVLIALVLVAAGIVGPLLFLLTRTVTTVDHAGITRKALGRRPRLLAFDHVTTLERYATESPTGTTKVVVTADDASTITIPTRRPDELVAALQGGRVFA
jgi:hypothetical protein